MCGWANKNYLFNGMLKRKRKGPGKLLPGFEKNKRII
jgi:hypothetical protein